MSDRQSRRNADETARVGRERKKERSRGRAGLVDFGAVLAFTRDLPSFFLLLLFTRLFERRIPLRSHLVTLKGKGTRVGNGSIGLRRQANAIQ